MATGSTRCASRRSTPTRCSSCASHPACRRTRSRSARSGAVVAGDGTVPVVLLLALAEEARELGREGIARRQVALVRQLVGPALELLDVGGGVLVGRHCLAHLLDIRLALHLELARVDGDV